MITILTIFLVFGMVLCGCWVVLNISFFVAPFSLLAVFRYAKAFNQDVSNWNTGAVTLMNNSKCTFSLSLWPRHLPLWCVVEYMRQLEVRRITSLTRFVLLFCLWFETGPLLCGGFWVFSLLHPSLFLQCLNVHLRSIRTCPPGIRGR